jgi:gamma-glutamyltranspeptidase / glutathione hydrolase
MAAEEHAGHLSDGRRAPERASGDRAGWRGRAGAPFATSKHEAVGSRFVIATNHPLAAAAGLEAYARGGNAVDAAVAAAFALTVVEPMMVSIFGAGMIVLRDGATGEITNVDNYAAAPAAARADMFTPLHPDAVWGDAVFATEGRKNAVGYLAAGVPGALQAWAALVAERGRLPLAAALAPAIRYAAEGFEVSPYLAHCIGTSAADLALFPASAAVFLPGGAPPRPGDRLARREYATTLEQIAQDGPAAFTTGPIAQAVAADMARTGVRSSTR